MGKIILAGIVVLILMTLLGWKFLGLLLGIAAVWCLIVGTVYNGWWVFKGDPAPRLFELEQIRDEWYIKDVDVGRCDRAYVCLSDKEYWFAESIYSHSKFDTEEKAEQAMLERLNFQKVYCEKPKPLLCSWKQAFYEWLTKECK